MSVNQWLRIFILLPILGACSQTYQESIDHRVKQAEIAQEKKSDIVVGVVWPYNIQPGFVNGVNLAVKEVNETDFDGDGVNGILNRQLKIALVDEMSVHPNYFSKKQRNLDQRLALQIAQKFNTNPNVVAVVGHALPTEAIAAGLSYQNHGILYLSPSSTNLLLTQPGFKLIFRLIPPNQEQAAQIAGYCALTKNYKNVVILYERSAYGEELADSFHETAAALGVHVAHRQSFFSYQQDFKSIIADFQGKKFDAVFLAMSEQETAVELIKQMRKMLNNLSFDIVGSHFLNLPSIGEEAGNAAEGFVVPAVFNASFNLAHNFVNKYKLAYGMEADTWAAQGYDSIKLLAHGMNEAGGTVPSMVATTLRYMRTWIGVTGVHSFEENGEIRGKKYFFRRWENGQFHALEGAHVPYSFYSLAHRRTKQDLTQ